jgi:hypothetical protein
MVRLSLRQRASMAEIPSSVGIAGEGCCIHGADARPHDAISVNAALYKRTQHADVH